MSNISAFSENGKYSFASDSTGEGTRCAFTAGENVTVRTYLPRMFGVNGGNVTLRADGEKKYRTFPMNLSEKVQQYDVFTVVLPPLLRGLYFVRFAFDTSVGKVSAASASGGVLRFHNGEEGEEFPLLYSEFLYAPPDWLYGGIIYHIFVDRFHRAGKTPVSRGGIWDPDWENGMPEYPAYVGAPLKNNVFFGGNLDGIREKLDHIASLGTTAIYLSPIFEAASNHKYDTGDYLCVDEGFGGDAALYRLIADAETRGISILLDGVFNHTGSDSRYFNKYGSYPTVGAYQSKESRYYKWYEFQSYPDKYTSWWNIDILPRLRTSEPSCREFFLGEDGVIRHWMRAGIKGFRLDVADELDDGFIAGIKTAMNDVCENAILYGEVWEDAALKIAYGKRKRYYFGRELDGVMNYPVRTGIIDFLRYGKTDKLRYALTDIIDHAPKRVADAQMNLLGSHDTERILTALAGEIRGTMTNETLAHKRLTSVERKKGITLLSLAYLTLATLPGIPTIYYGDEVGMEGYGDPFNRMPYPWHNVDEEILLFYRRIGELRRSNPVYRTGDFRLLSLTPIILHFARFSETHEYRTLIHRGTEKIPFVLPEQAEILYGENAMKNNELLPNSGMIYRIPKK